VSCGARLRRRCGPHRTSGVVGVGGCAGSGTVGATPWDDYFDCGTIIDTVGARYPGANAWTKYNDGGAPFAQTGGYLEPTTNGGPIAALQTLPAGDWVFRCKVQHVSNGGSFPCAGIYLRESATDKGTGACVVPSGGAETIEVRRYSAGPSWTATYSGPIVGPGGLGVFFWLEVERVGSTLSYRYSQDGATFADITPATTLTADFTTAPDQVGVFWNGFAITTDFDWFVRYEPALPYNVPLVNPGAELGTAGWTNVTNTLGTRAIPHSGSACFHINSVGAFEVYQEWNASLFASLIDAGGVTATLAGWGRPWEGATSSFHIRLDALDSGGSSLATASTSNWSPSTTYSQKSVPLSLPNGTRKLRATFEGSNTATSDCWLDDVTLALS
jgi:hypothetical protein